DAPILLCRALFFDLAAASATHPLSLHDALPISPETRAISAAVSYGSRASAWRTTGTIRPFGVWAAMPRWTALCWVSTPASSSYQDRKSTRLNSSHVKISYAVFCLKKNSEDSTDC